VQPGKLYKLKHLTKLEVVANDPSGCTFFMVPLPSSSDSTLFADDYYIISSGIEKVPMNSFASA
jgi:hypothetical protein